MNESWLESLAQGARPTHEDVYRLLDVGTEALTQVAGRRRDLRHVRGVSFSKKVFIPLTRLCRDTCHYCTFAIAPRKGHRAFLTPDETLAIAQAGARAGCQEALFTLGDKPELRYAAARDELASLGHTTTLSYLSEVAQRVHRETGLLPHLNPGVMDAADLALLRPVSISMGLMLESASERLCERGGPHYGSPDKRPARRLETLRLAGAAAIPFTTGLLIGIGETRRERLASLLAIRDLHDDGGHIQEVIIQNFMPKPGTKMAGRQAAASDEHVWTIAAARLIFDPQMNIQAPPNLASGRLERLVAAGVNDWGGVSPVTPDHVNPEAPWPEIEALQRATEAAGKPLVERLAIYPAYAAQSARWVAAELRPDLLARIDAAGWPRGEAWWPGARLAPPESDLDLVQKSLRRPAIAATGVGPILERAQAGLRLGESEIVRLFDATGRDFAAVCRAADELRRSLHSDVVSYVVTRNINYTNVCSYRCQFCAFSKGKMSENLRGRPYDLPIEEISRRAGEARERGASEVCMQGGIHPSYTGRTYLDICRAVKAAAPDMHVHAFSPLEVRHGAETLGLSVPEFLGELKAAGLATLPGTAAEILDDEIRATLCPDKIRTTEWLDVMRAAHAIGLRSTATIMFGHMESYVHWARHLLRLRDLQADTQGFTEFVPLPFVHMEAPIYLKGRARRGPTFREAILMHAVARLSLYPHIAHVQVSWVKMGPEGAAASLCAGADDLGGTLMDESISRAAGAIHGQEMTPQAMEELIRRAGRTPRQRTTLYGDAPEALRARSFRSAHERTGGSGAPAHPASARRDLHEAIGK